MISCKAVARLLDSDALQSQSWRTRLQIRVHLWMCRYCARLERQIAAIQRAARATAAEEPPPLEFEEKLIDRLSSGK